jgi:hypothetical protein
MAEPSLDLILKLQTQTLVELRQSRAEQRDLRDLLLKTIDFTRRIERRVEELRDDLELMIKAEIGGRLAHVETRLEQHVDLAVEAALARHAPTSG